MRQLAAGGGTGPRRTRSRRRRPLGAVVDRRERALSLTTPVGTSGGPTRAREDRDEQLSVPGPLRRERHVARAGSAPVRGAGRAPRHGVAEDPFWETGNAPARCTAATTSTTVHDQAFGHFSYVNALQRDMCPSATKFEAEIIAMTLDLFRARRSKANPVGWSRPAAPVRIAPPSSPTASKRPRRAASPGRM